MAIRKLLVLFFLLQCAYFSASELSTSTLEDDRLLGDLCSFRSPDQPSPTCGWYSSPKWSAWILSNKPTTEEIDAGLVGDATPSSEGYFLVARTTDSQNGLQFVLVKDVRGGEGRIFSFKLHMSGNHGSLDLKLKTAADNSTYHNLYQVSGDQGSNWMMSPDIPIGDCNDYVIIITAIIKRGSTTSIALDDFIFKDDPKVQARQPGPGIPRDELCWNDASYLLSMDNTRNHVCCCSPGFTGMFCQTNIDECANSTCMNGATCMDQVDGYGCLCTEDFHGKFCQYRIDNCQGVPCHNNGLCVDGVNDYSCLCSPGYTGRNCALQIDPCVNITCKNGGTCLGLSTKLFICSCPSGYSGIYCEEDLSVCNTRQPCGELATCFDGRGDEYMCICPPGETPVVNSGLMSCKDTVDSCASHPCLEGATCIDTRLGYECHCPTGTSGARCQYNPDDCQTKPCNNGGTCKDGFNSFECRCPLGFSGTQCEIDIRNEFCLKQCKIKNTANCSFDGGKITCICIQGFMGERCQHRMPQCTSNPCKRGICTEKSIGYKCGCEAGWTGYNCDTQIALCPSVDCGPHGSCLETDTGPQCFCQTDYTGIYCETRIDPCVGIVCKNGGICVAVYEQYEPWVCNCSSDIYIGKYCEYELAVSAIAQSQQMPDPILDTCSNFWTISPELRKAILIISIAANFTILALGLIIIQMCVRSARLRLSRKLNESTRYYNSTRSFPPYRIRY